jgi:hypothetical protein
MTGLVLLIALASCGKKESTEEIPFTEYSWAYTDCQWTDPGSDNSVIIINSKTELEKHLICTENSYPEIDFSKHTLLSASGLGAFSVENASLFQNSKDEYKLEVAVMEAHITHELSNRVHTWHIAIVAPKISDAAKINLKVNVKELY